MEKNNSNNSEVKVPTSVLINDSEMNQVSNNSTNTNNMNNMKELTSEFVLMLDDETKANQIVESLKEFTSNEVRKGTIYLDGAPTCYDINIKGLNDAQAFMVYNYVISNFDEYGKLFDEETGEECIALYESFDEAIEHALRNN